MYYKNKALELKALKRQSMSEIRYVREIIKTILVLVLISTIAFEMGILLHKFNNPVYKINYELYVCKPKIQCIPTRQCILYK